MVKKLTRSVGNFTHADIVKMYENGTVDCEMIVIEVLTDKGTGATTELKNKGSVRVTASGNSGYTTDINVELDKAVWS